MSTLSAQRKLDVLATVTPLLATVLSVVLLADFGSPDWPTTLFLASLCILAELFATQLPVVGAVSLSSGILLAAVLFGGPSTGVLVAALGSVSVTDILSGKPLKRMLFNTGQYVLGAGLSSVVFLAVGATPLQWRSVAGSADIVWFAAVALAALVLAAVNVLLAGTAIAFFTETSLREVWRRSLSSLTVSLFALSVLGMVLAELLHVAGIAGTLLIVVPFMIARQTFEVFQRQSMAYRDTVRSLVAAIEAKDPYTRGHSERVAWYAVEIARGMGLPDSECQRIEWAALLHDIGKVAIDTQILNKPTALSPSESDVVRKHPEQAEAILDDIDFLEEAIPLIRSHHERLDGSGYPSGLADEDIELGARILAVADSFDAMTSSRAYRQALSVEEATDELLGCAGAGLDIECVRQLLAVVDADTVHRLMRPVVEPVVVS